MFCRRLIFLLVVASLVPACGRKEPPKPPPSKIPAPISDLEIQQRGQEVILTMSYPSVTLGGLPIDELEALEIWKVSRILSTFVESTDQGLETEAAEEEGTESEEPVVEEPAAEEPEASLFSLPSTVVGDNEEEQQKESLIEVRGKDFAAIAVLVHRQEGSQLDSAVVGNQLFVKIPLEEVTQRGDEEEILVFGARTLVDKQRASPFSNLVKLYPRTPPPAPTNLTVEATPDGVQIDWEIIEDAIGYRVYRRNAKVRDYAEPLYKAREDLGSYLDRSAVFGERYIYTVTSVGNLEPPVESAVAAEHEVDYKDRFPPTTPTEVVALPETGRVRLLWQPSSSADTQGYWIYRQDPGASFRAVNAELIVGSEYLDIDLASGLTYRYYILAVDTEGNLSTPSEEIAVRVP